VPGGNESEVRGHLTPLAPVLGGEGLGVRGSCREATTHPQSLAPGGRREMEEAVMATARKQHLLEELCRLFEESSGLDLPEGFAGHSFFELGLDSLFLTQACLTLQRKYQVPLTFRQLIEDLSSPTRLAEYLDQHLLAEAEPASAPPAPAPAPLTPLPSTP